MTPNRCHSCCFTAALIGKVCQVSNTDPNEILDAVIGGNTTMLQLAAGIDSTPLGRVPFTVGMESGCTYPVERFGLKINARARIYIPPVVHAFVGSDISAGLLSIDFFHHTSPLLFIDLGTNGEMALIAKGLRIVTSAAAGPAFEGMGISCGMQAAAGAIETVWANGNFLCLRTINDAPARGICGSGIMDLIASLIRLDAVEPNGRLNAPPTNALWKGPFTERYTMIGKTAAIRLTDNITFTQKDISQFQLAKSAVQTGAEMLLVAAKMNPADLARMFHESLGIRFQISKIDRVEVKQPHFDGFRYLHPVVLKMVPKSRPQAGLRRRPQTAVPSVA